MVPSSEPPLEPSFHSVGVVTKLRWGGAGQNVVAHGACSGSSWSAGSSANAGRVSAAARGAPPSFRKSTFEINRIVVGGAWAPFVAPSSLKSRPANSRNVSGSRDRCRCTSSSSFSLKRLHRARLPSFRTPVRYSSISSSSARRTVARGIRSFAPLGRPAGFPLCPGRKRRPGPRRLAMALVAPVLSSQGRERGEARAAA